MLPRERSPVSRVRENRTHGLMREGWSTAYLSFRSSRVRQNVMKG